MPKNWDDNRLRGKSGSNITVGDKTLEEFLDLEESKQEALDRERDLQADKQTIYRSNKPKYAETKERSGKGQSLPQETINRDYWREMLMSEIKKRKSLAQLVLSVLISGESFGNRPLAEAITATGRKTSSGAIASVTGSIFASDLCPAFIERSHAIEPTSQKAMHLYKINKFGQALTLEQLVSIYKKADPLTPWNIKEQVSQLVTLGYEPPELRPELQPAREEQAAPKKEPKVRSPVKSPGILAPPITTNLPAIPSEINININFTFAFKLIKD